RGLPGRPRGGDARRAAARAAAAGRARRHADAAGIARGRARAPGRNRRAGGQAEAGGRRRMSEPLHFVVDQVPVPWQRARLAKAGHHFTDAETRAWKRVVAVLGKAAMRGRPLLDGPVELLVVFLLPVPPSWPDWKRRLALAGRLVPTAKPDWDNL